MSCVERLLAPLLRDCGVVTVIDGHLATLAWIGGVYGHRVKALGVEHFGQTGTRLQRNGLPVRPIICAFHPTSIQGKFCRQMASRRNGRCYQRQKILVVAGRRCCGYVLDALLQSRRDKTAALRLMRKLLEGQCVAPRVIITDKLRSYNAARREIMPSVEHRSHKGVNNRRRIRIWLFDDENEA